ncbi:MAG: hypothetical protein JO290_05000 [Sphingomonadaceae bacterium]|nr:hypothetical protein [Sphingomonadaceae bacterium]
MATLILGTIGRVIGGPIGGLVGTLVGSTLDRGLFGGATREGPRLANLTVQSAAYGEPLPRIYGRMRVAGNLVWTAGIKESRQHSGGGKGGPATNTYSYSSSFAVVVAARPIAGVERIWADGKLLRAADGTLNFPATIRTYLGGEAQPVDPLIAAAEGTAGTPAYRGLAYLVFEDLPLADYGNRIPNLTFEVVADAEPVAVDAIAADLAPVERQAALPTVVGFAAATGGTIRQALTALAVVADLTLGDNGLALRIGAGTAATPVGSADLGVSDHATAAERHAVRAADTTIPDAIWLSYGDVDREYQTGIQAAARRSPALRVEQHDLTIAAAAADVKLLADAALRRAIAARTTQQIAVPWRYADVQLGDFVLAGDDPQPWRVTHRTITGGAVTLDLARVAAAPVAALVADPGRAYAATDAPQGATVIHVLDLPPLPGPLPMSPLLLLAASGASPGWRRADILFSRDGGDSYAVAATIGTPATIGTTRSVLAAGPTTTWDRLASVDVDLLRADDSLVSASDPAVLAGANLALIGDEVVQFGTAIALGGTRFRLSNLLRGRRGSEAAVPGHVGSERFVLLDDRLTTFALPVELVGASLQFKGVGPLDDPAGQRPTVVVPAGKALRPLSPVALTVDASAQGDRVLTWVRRSRAGFAWSDGTDAPLAEQDERYHVIVRRGAAVLRQTDVVEPRWVYPAAAAQADLAGGPVTIEVAQVSAAVGAGAAATITL